MSNIEARLEALEKRAKGKSDLLVVVTGRGCECGPHWMIPGQPVRDGTPPDDLKPDVQFNFVSNVCLRAV
jgi:hypothetical protein